MDGERKEGGEKGRETTKELDVRLRYDACLERGRLAAEVSPRSSCVVLDLKPFLWLERVCTVPCGVWWCVWCWAAKRRSLLVFSEWQRCWSVALSVAVHYEW